VCVRVFIDVASDTVCGILLKISIIFCFVFFCRVLQRHQCQRSSRSRCSRTTASSSNEFSNKVLRPSHVAFAGGTWLGTIPTPRVATAFGQAWRRRLNVKQRGMHRWQLLLQQQWHVQMGQNLRQLRLAQLQLMDQNLGQLWLMQLQLMPQSDGACAVSSQPGTGF
jgi:hypothetical protein